MCVVRRCKYMIVGEYYTLHITAPQTIQSYTQSLTHTCARRACVRTRGAHVPPVRVRVRVARVFVELDEVDGVIFSS